VPGEPASGVAGGHPRPRIGVHLHLARRRRAAVLPQGRRHLAQAEAFKRRIDDQLARGTYTPASTMTFGTYATGWIETWPLKDQTRERYRGKLCRELMPIFGGYPLAKIHPHQVRAWVHEQNAGPLSSSSVRQHIAVLRSCLKAAQIDGHLGELPLLGVKMPRSYSRQPAVLTLTEAFAMIDAAPAGWQCAIATALFTGGGRQPPSHPHGCRSGVCSAGLTSASSRTRTRSASCAPNSIRRPANRMSLTP
jgi:hypothetical protein